MGWTISRRRQFAGALLLTVACGQIRTPAIRVVDEFVVAVQLEDADALFCLLAGASDPGGDADDDAVRRETFENWLASRYGEYERGRDAGWVDLQGDGVVLSKTFALGKGTFYALTPLTADEDTAEILMSIRFAYAEIDVSGLPPGSIFYVAGEEPGRIHPVRIPYGPGIVSEDVLETLDVRWTLQRTPASPSCPAGWDIVSVEPVPDTATTRRLVWEF